MQRETFVVQLMPAGASAHNRKASKKFDHDGTLDLLIRHGANMEARDWAGWSTLMVATFYGQPTLVRALVEAGARIDHVDHNGKAALEMAASIDSLAHRQIARTLKRAGKTRAAVELSTRRWHELRWSSLGAFAALLAVCAIAFVRADNSLARALSSGGSRLQHDMRTNHTHGGGRRHTAGGIARTAGPGAPRAWAGAEPATRRRRTACAGRPARGRLRRCDWPARPTAAATCAPSGAAAAEARRAASTSAGRDAAERGRHQAHIIAHVAIPGGAHRRRRHTCGRRRGGGGRVWIGSQVEAAGRGRSSVGGGGSRSGTAGAIRSIPRRIGDTHPGRRRGGDERNGGYGCLPALPIQPGIQPPP